VHQVLFDEARASAAILPSDGGADLLPATIELATPTCC